MKTQAPKRVNHRPLRANHGGLISVLHETQEKHRYLPEEVLVRIAEEFGLPLTEVYGVATFFRAFSLEPKGEHVCTVCMGTACHVRGSPRILEEAEKLLGVHAGQTTPDKRFTLETVNCLGACALGPLLVMDGKYHGNMKPSKVAKVIPLDGHPAGKRN